MKLKDMMKIGGTEENENRGVKEIEEQIRTLVQNRDDLIYQLGLSIYKNMEKTALLGQKEQEYITEIQKMEEEEDLLEIKKLFMQGLRRCDKCKNTLPKDSMFCNKCGNKLEDIPEEVQSSICANCGKELEEGTVFCPECGTKVE